MTQPRALDLLTLLTLVLVVIALACTSEDKPSTSETATPAVTPTFDPTTFKPPTIPPNVLATFVAQPTPAPFDPTTIPGLTIKKQSVGDQVEFPPDTGFIVSMGCTQCDGPVKQVLRVYRNGTGPVRTDVIIDQAWLTARGVPQEGMFDLAISPDGGTFVVGICTKGYCYGGSDPVNERTFYRSTDGGFSWEKLGPSNLEGWVSHVFRDGAVITLASPSGPGNAPLNFSYHYLDGRPIAKPVAADVMVYGQLTDPIWWDIQTRSLLNPDGSTLLKLPAQTSQGQTPIAGRPEPSESLAYVAWPDKTRAPFVMWSPPPASPDRSPGCFVTVPMGNDLHRGVYDASTCAQPIAWLNDRTYVANHFYMYADRMLSQASLVDIDTGVVRPIEGAPAEHGGRNWVNAVLKGPFLRTNASPCLNLRAAASTTAAVLHCAPAGVLLRPNGSTVSAEGRDWRPVLLPDGRRAWAATEGLE